MLMKKITYEDIHGVERTETFYFNLTKTELIKMNMGVNGGLQDILQEIIDSKATPNIVKMFDKIVALAYGERDENNLQLNKSDDISKKFFNHPAYDVLFMELISDPKAAADFINKIIPKELAEEAAKAGTGVMATLPNA